MKLVDKKRKASGKEPLIPAGDQLENEDIEIKMLIDAAYLKYGYDFRNYAKASLKRRIKQRLAKSNIKSVSEFHSFS